MAEPKPTIKRTTAGSKLTSSAKGNERMILSKAAKNSRADSLLRKF